MDAESTGRMQAATRQTEISSQATMTAMIQNDDCPRVSDSIEVV